ncbi:MAG TPA: AsmA family protein, partial [Pseudomonadales bacterium]|nr:AsmA family protein [Pseudomonadales bacterium]
MNPLLKWILTAVVALLLLVGGATVALRVLVDEERLEATLVELVNGNVDATLAIDGGVKLSLWPTLALAADGVRLRTPAGAGEDVATARLLRLGVALLPLLRNELRVSELVLDGLTLNAACDANATCNWAALAGTGQQEQAPPPADVAAGGATAPMLLNIARIRVRDSTLVYTDREAGARYELAGLALDGEDINMDGRPFRLEGGATLTLGAERRELKIALELPAAAIDANARTLAVPALKLAASGMELDAAVNADWSQRGAATASGTLDLKKLDLPALLQTLGTALPPAVNAAPLADITLGSRFAWAGDKLTLDELKLRAGSFSGAGSAKLGLGGATRIEATISSPELDLDYFLPPQEAPPPATTSAPPAAGAPAEAQGLAALLTVDGNINAKLGRLKRGKLELSDIDARLQMSRGSAQLQKLDARLYGGTLNATGALAATTDTGSMNVSAQVAGVDLQALLASTQQKQQFAGRANGSLTLAATGADPATWKNTLSGPVQLGIDEPVLKDLSVEQVICRAAAQLNQEALTAHFAPDTHLRSIRAALDFSQGVGHIRQLHAAVPDMEMRGEGRIDLPRRKLDIQLNTRVTDDLGKLDHACRMSRKMLAIEWPVSCKGRFDEPPKKWCGIDKDDVVLLAAPAATEKVQDKLMKKLGDLL